MREAGSRLAGALASATPDPLDAPAPPAWLLSNGDYTTLLSAAGTGGSWLGELALTRWAGDRVEDRDGCFLYLRDRESGALWSLGSQPVRRPAGDYRATWRPGRVEIARDDDGIEARLEAVVAPRAALEMRRITLRNRSARSRALDLASYVEVVLAGRAADRSHLAFSKLFVQTEFDPGSGALLARRRPRERGERLPWMVHALLGDGALEHETDRARFIGRGAGLDRPQALRPGAPLSGATGSVLDPIFALRRAVDLGPGASAQLVFVLGAAPGRSEALGLLDHVSAPARVEEMLAAAESAAGEELRRLGISPEEAERYQALAGGLLYAHPRLRADPERIARASGSRASLAALGLSPQRPLAVADARAPVDLEGLAALLAAHRYWRALGLDVDLVVLCADPERLPGGVPRAGGEGVQVRSTRDMPEAEVDLLLAAAHLLVDGSRPSPTAIDLHEVAARPPPAPPPGPGDGRPAVGEALSGAGGLFTEPLECFNGFGGFGEGGEYVIRLAHRPHAGLLQPPLPWVNVVANEGFGFIVSETGAGCTWSCNSREHRLTPWSNDPVLDPHGEALYLRDEESGAYWSPLPGPVPQPADYEMRHGFGYSRCRHVSEGLEQEVCVFVPRHDPVKITRVRLHNRGRRTRRLSLFGYQRLVLGGSPGESGRFVVTGFDAGVKALLARNPAAGEHADRVAFAAVVTRGSPLPVHFSGDREAFIGRGGGPERPLVLRRGATLDGRTGAGLDPCFAEQCELEIPAGASVECAFLLGEGAGDDQARALIARYREPGAIDRAFDEVRGFWSDLLSRVRVHTPVPAIDLMVNGWLLYQDLACRIWGRSAFYQSGGAFGFRDQLQDAAAFAGVRPRLAREQILLHAGHQFVEGDVLHWWHPPLDRGLRTRFADDLLWLPHITAQYVRATGDEEILERVAPFLVARPLEEGEDEAFLEPEDSGQSASLYEHCCRAIDRSLECGAHGLPLFGAGDWNDGMNLVGHEGRGESVWMGFFLHAILGEFAPLCERRGDRERGARYRRHREALRAAVNDAGWDGEWYRRGFYDDGAPLGSRASDECRIDALAQAWAVLSGAAPPARAARALDAVERLLVSERDGIVRLLAPPFDRTPREPGYIKGYVPGVRENGGQYTHAALWFVGALAQAGRRERAAKLLEMLSPVSHALTPEQVSTYRVEPYVIAADVYGEPPHVGRGGWTWYTGSAGWMFRTAVESVLGVRVEGGEALVIRPCIPDPWHRCTIDYRLPDETTRYEIVIENPGASAAAVIAASADGATVTVRDGAARVPLVHDGGLHRVEVTLGGAPDERKRAPRGTREPREPME
ncbi:MAG: hypothetical protein A2W00_10670 [Candidatus Eisenbacteria bacterium RBG_16_71_46]|nr:MAG: hypothetical protein A2W00_10670 [Candidatus Eisenbacteria bacterium RBG_16_71_46]